MIDCVLFLEFLIYEIYLNSGWISNDKTSKATKLIFE